VRQFHDPEVKSEMEDMRTQLEQAVSDLLVSWDCLDSLFFAPSVFS